jgi:hypothetical protein
VTIIQDDSHLSIVVIMESLLFSIPLLIEDIIIVGLSKSDLIVLILLLDSI